MLNIKKILLLVISGIFITSCSKKQNNTNYKIDNNSKLKVIATIFPAYDWTKNIAGNNIDLELLISDETDLHSYEPTVADIVKISNCDLLIYIGGESDKWVNQVLQNSSTKKIQTINLIDSLGTNAKQEELIEGMQEEHEHDKHNNDDDNDEVEYDEHIWLSLKNAKHLSLEIATKLMQLDENNKNFYLENANNYINQLDALDKEYATKLLDVKTKTILVADRFPFRYLVDDYYLNYFAAFNGCSAETEASFKTIAFLATKIDELNLSSIFKIENSNDKLANTIIENSSNKNIKVFTLNSMQSITAQDIQNKQNYQKIMQNNLNTLVEALQ